MYATTMLRMLTVMWCLAVLVAVPTGCGGDGEPSATATTAKVEEDQAAEDSTATTGDGTAATNDTETSDLQAGASDRFIGTWIDMQGNVGPFHQFTLNDDGSAIVIDRDGNELQALWSVEEIGQGSWYELTVEAEDGQKLDSAVEWVSETEFKRKNADGSWVQQ